MAEETTYYVVDTNATNGPRIHDMVNAQGRIIRYEFKDFVTATAVPHSHAMRFSAIPGFEVYDSDQNAITTKEVKGASGSAALTLRADEVIANLEELTVEALRARVLKIPEHGNPKAVARMKRDDLVAKLVAAGKPRIEIDDEDGDGDDLIDAEIDEDDPLLAAVTEALAPVPPAVKD